MSPHETSSMSLIAAHGGPTAVGQLGDAAEDDGMLNQRRVIGITGLPREILRDIFEFFQHPATVGQKIGLESIDIRFGEDQLKNIQNLRLACKLFDEEASPLLVPIIRVAFDQPSLDRVLGLLGNPRIAAGVLAIKVELRYYFNVVAASLSDFARYRMVDIHYVEDYFMHLEIADTMTAARAGRALSREIYNSHVLSCQRSRSFGFACRRHIREQSTPHTRPETPDPGADPNQVEQYYDMIGVAYEKYKVQCHDQHRIATEKSLVNGLAKLVSLSGRRVCLSIFEKGCTHGRRFPDNPEFGRELEAPDGWNEFWGLRQRPIEAELARQLNIIWDLPIAIHKAGGIFDSFEIQHLVADIDYRLLCPESLSPGGHQLDQLRAACQHLRIFRFEGLQHRKRPEESITQNFQMANTSVSDFLQTVLSSRLLEEVDVTGPMKAWERVQGRRSTWFLGRTISNLHFQHLSTISLGQMSIFPRHMTFHRRDLRFRPTISMTGLTGGNFGMLRDQLARATATAEEPSPAGETTPQAIDDKLLEHKLLELFQAYITSDQELANPGLGNFEN
ncbi:unnamed protein product [Clonostachys byssicola]|uniref:Uncharacterized protein n=1 Tax=Clonostachys byssicola TaxID=160290 RepID=A0A9N9UYJ5_9HYPO|nr:unnamed protein product [Clonostachys byssicola]